jgi:hypothetical protein
LVADDEDLQMACSTTKRTNHDSSSIQRLIIPSEVVIVNVKETHKYGRLSIQIFIQDLHLFPCLLLLARASTSILTLSCSHSLGFLCSSS